MWVRGNLLQMNSTTFDNMNSVKRKLSTILRWNMAPIVAFHLKISNCHILIQLFSPTNSFIVCDTMSFGVYVLAPIQ